MHIQEDYESDSPSSTYLDIVYGKGFDEDKVTAENFCDQDITFDLYLNIKRLTTMYKHVNGRWSFEEFKMAFLTKALSLVRYGSVEYMNFLNKALPYRSNQVWEYIFELSELCRCQYQLSCDMPAFSKYLEIYNMTERKTVTMEMIHEDMERFEHIVSEFDTVSSMLHELYFLTIHNRSDGPGNISEFALPYVQCARRGTVFDSANAAEAIYNYILLPNELHKVFNFQINELFMEVEEETDEVFEDDRPIIQADEAIGFYRDVLIKRMEEILRVRNVFKRIFSMTEQVEVYEGDIDLRKQQQMYVNSLTGDEGRTYLQRKFKNTSMDVVIVRDISFSTDLNKVEYAEVIVELLAALEGIESVRTAQIDFSDIARLNKRFEQPVGKASVAPEAFGATKMLEALNIIEKLDFYSSKRLVFIITDGEIEDYEQCQEMITEMEATQNTLFFNIHIIADIYGEVSEIDGKSAVSSMGMLDKVIFHMLIKELT